MAMTVDLGHVFTGLLAFFAYLAYQNLTGTVSRIENECRTSIARVESEGKRSVEDAKKENGARIAKLEDSHAVIPQQIERLSREIADRISNMELKLSQQHPTRQELEAVAVDRSNQFRQLWEKVDSLSKEVTVLVATIQARTPDSSQMKRTHA